MSSKGNLLPTKTNSLQPELRRLLKRAEAICWENTYNTDVLKINEYKDDFTVKTEIGAQLLVIFELIGLRADNFPSTNARKAIASFIQTQYHFLSPKELMDAYTLAFNGTIDVSLAHFQSFSIPHLTSVITAYLDYKRDSLNKIDSLTEKLAEAKKVADNFKKSDQSVKSKLVTLFDDTSKDLTVEYFYPLDNAYYFFKDCGFVTLTDEEMESIKLSTKAQAQLKQEHYVGEQMRLHIGLSKDDHEKKKAEYHEHAKTVHNWLSMAREKGLRLEIKKCVDRGLSKEDFERILQEALCFVDPVALERHRLAKQSLKL